jgi:hypothetical protein
MASINNLPIRSQSWIPLPISSMNKGIYLKRTGNYFLQLINFQLLFLLQFFFYHITLMDVKLLNEGTNQHPRLYSVASLLSSCHLYQGTRYIYKGDTYFSTSILQQLPWEKTVKPHVLHSDFYKKSQTPQLRKTINAGIYNWESRTEELYLPVF